MLETGKGCCRNSIRGQCAVRRPMLNKLPINISFISGHNQCRTDRADQLTLLIQRKEGDEAHTREGWDRQWQTDKKERVPDSGEISLSPFSVSLTERWGLKHRVPTPCGPLGCGVEDTVTESRPGLSPKRKEGLGGSGPCLAALPACDVGSALGKLLLLSSHHTWSILIRPDCTFPSSCPQPKGTV